jgi:hypothetical protein
MDEPRLFTATTWFCVLPIPGFGGEVPLMLLDRLSMGVTRFAGRITLAEGPRP